MTIRPRDSGTLLGSFDTPLEPDDVRQHLIAQGMQAFAEDVGIDIPEIPEIVVGEITAIEPSTYQTIRDRA